MSKGVHPFLKVIGQNDLDVIAARNAAAVVACDPKEDKARQEFLADTDVNNVVNRYGENFHAMRGPLRDVDYDLDLTRAFEAVEESQAAWFRLPEPVRARFRSWEALVKAALDGSLSEFLKPAEGAPVPGAPVGGSASGSAPVTPPVGG